MTSNQVDDYMGRFSGSFPLDYEIGDSVEIDDVVTFMVTGVIKGDSRKVKSDDVVKEWKFGVHDAVPIPAGKVAALKSALSTSGDVMSLFIEQQTLDGGIEISDDDLEFDDEDELSV